MSIEYKVERHEDMTRGGKLRLLVQDDGDIIVEVLQGDTNSRQITRVAAVEFCIPGTGGGRSRHTHAALRALVIAMSQDNEERPT